MREGKKWMTIILFSLLQSSSEPGFMSEDTSDTVLLCFWCGTWLVIMRFKCHLWHLVIL